MPSGFFDVEAAPGVQLGLREGATVCLQLLPDHPRISWPPFWISGFEALSLNPCTLDLSTMIMIIDYDYVVITIMSVTIL